MSGDSAPWRQFRSGLVDGFRSARASRRLKIIAGAIGGVVGVGYLFAVA